MSTATRLGGFALVAVVVFAGAYGVGRLVGPTGTPADLAFRILGSGRAPGDGTTPGPRITFTAQVPTTGTYRLFLEFQHFGQVHTAAFTQEVA